MVRDVIVVPLSGYANRFQAIASASIIADDLGARLAIDWVPDTAAPAPADVVFDPSFLTAVRGANDKLDEGAVDLESIPLYVDVDEAARAITVRGHLLGEQHFMPHLRTLLEQHPAMERIVFVAGGKFTLAAGETLTDAEAASFRRRRTDFYRWLRLHPTVEAEAAQAAATHAPYIGLHLRYSDRNHQAPTRRQVRGALRQIRQRSQLTSLFIASDDAEQREYWMTESRELGFEPWAAPQSAFARSDPRSTQAALTDWRILGSSEAMVFFAESSFGEEAAVASGHYDDSIGLTASRARTSWVSWKELARAAITYPKRHWIG